MSLRNNLSYFESSLLISMADTVYELYNTWNSHIILLPCSWTVRLIVVNGHLSCSVFCYYKLHCYEYSYNSFMCLKEQMCKNFYRSRTDESWDSCIILLFQRGYTSLHSHPQYMCSSCLTVSSTLFIVRVLDFCQSHGWDDMMLCYFFICIS